MAKRFTETLKWEDPWFRRLPPNAKHLWQWFLDHCDHAGVIEPDLELAAFQIGYGKGNDTLLGSLGDRIIKLPNGKLWIPKFIEFQYGTLSESCPAHKPVFKSLERNGVNTLPEGYGKGSGKLLDTDKDKDKDKAKDTDTASETDPLLPHGDTFREAWADWENHRTEIRKPLKPTMRKAQLRTLAAIPEADAVAMIRHTLTMGWQGLRAPDPAPRVNGYAKPDHRAEKAAREYPEPDMTLPILR